MPAVVSVLWSQAAYPGGKVYRLVSTVCSFLPPPSAVTHTPRGGALNCAQVIILENPFRSQRTLNAHPSQLQIGVLSSSMSVAPPSSPNPSPSVNGCVVWFPVS